MNHPCCYTNALGEHCPLHVSSSEIDRCKHDVDGTDCRVCFLSAPLPESDWHSRVREVVWRYARNTEEAGELFKELSQEIEKARAEEAKLCTGCNEQAREAVKTEIKHGIASYKEKVVQVLEDLRVQNKSAKPADETEAVDERAYEAACREAIAAIKAL